MAWRGLASLSLSYEISHCRKLASPDCERQEAALRSRVQEGRQRFSAWSSRVSAWPSPHPLLSYISVLFSPPLASHTLSLGPGMGSWKGLWKSSLALSSLPTCAGFFQRWKLCCFSQEISFILPFIQLKSAFCSPYCPLSSWDHGTALQVP